MNKKIKSHLSKINFILNRNPIIEKKKNWRKYIPEPYKAVVTITADFELAWAWRYSKNSPDPYKLAIEKAKRERENIPKILDLCEKFQIPITWATIGHLFLEKCERDKSGKAHPEIPRLNHFENEFWKYEGKDWYEYDPCSNYLDAPEWYAPDLIKMILDSKISHEIACHTFSHIDCRDEVCSPELFKAEIFECQKAASKFGVKLKSFVHPGHTIGNLDSLVPAGFLSFQTDNGNILGYPLKHKSGLWELKRSYEFSFRKEWNEKYHIYRYRKIIERAIKNHSVCNFWFHPSYDNIFQERIFPMILEYLQVNKKKVFISTVANYLNTISKRH